MNMMSLLQQYPLVFAIAGLAVLVASCVFLYTLHKTLAAVSDKNRAMAPGLVWLNLIPLVNVVWLFYTVIKLRDSLRKEFEERRIEGGGDYGFALGMAMSVLNLCALIPALATVAFLAFLIVWIVYWVKIAGLKKALAPA